MLGQQNGLFYNLHCFYRLNHHIFVKQDVPLYRIVKDTLNIHAGTVLSYIPFTKQDGLQWQICKEYLIQLGKDGVSFVTIHFTTNLGLLELAQNRNMPMTSRGGGMCLYDMQLNRRKKNLFLEHIDEIVDIALQYDITISLGITFRPGNIFDACDEVHIAETKQQLAISKYLKSKSLQILFKGINIRSHRYHPISVECLLHIFLFQTSLTHVGKTQVNCFSFF